MIATTYPEPDSLVRSFTNRGTDQQLRAAINRLLVRRTRIALAGLMGGMALFSIADLWRHAPGLLELFELRAISVGLVVCAYMLLRQPRFLPYTPLIAWLVFATGSTLIALAGIASPVASSATPILCVLFTFTAGALFPWGPRMQLSAAAVAVADIGFNLYWVYTPEHPVISYQGVEGVVVCLVCSVICGAQAQSRLLELIRENFERKRAEVALRLSSQHLERRVQERIAELEAAKADLARQVTENQHTAETLRESENLLRAIIDNSSAIIQVKDLEGRYRLTNALHARLFRCPTDEIVGKTPYDIFPAEAAASFAANDRQILAVDHPVQFEETIPQDDGEHTYLSVKFPLRHPTGVTYGICGISTDITERKRMESALRHSQSTLSALIENSDEAIWALDQDYRIQLLNSTARVRFPQAYGTQPEIGADFRELLPADVRSYWSAPFAQALSGERLASETAAVVNGETLQFLVSLNPIIDARGVMGVTIFVKDITTLKQAEAQLREHQAELAHVLRRSTMGELAAELTHEINQPLGAIANYAQGCRLRLQSGNIDLTELGHAIDQIASEAQRAEGILERLRSTTLQEPARDEPIDVNELVRNAVRALEFRCTGLLVQLALAPELPQGHGDVIQVEQVLMNLLHNAIDALQVVPSATRRLTVETHLADGPAIEVAVRDTGQGLDPALAGDIFEPFVTTKSDGLGMGLAISRSIVEAHHGRLRVTSHPEGGCTFHFTLPLGGAPAAA